MTEEKRDEVMIRAYSPGKYPILVIEFPESPGELRTIYYETGYDLDRTKRVGEEWLTENALGRHSFVKVDPPRSMPAASLRDYVGRGLLEEP